MNVLILMQMTGRLSLLSSREENYMNVIDLFQCKDKFISLFILRPCVEPLKVIYQNKHTCISNHCQTACRNTQTFSSIPQKCLQNRSDWSRLIILAPSLCLRISNYYIISFLSCTQQVTNMMLVVVEVFVDIYSHGIATKPHLFPSDPIPVSI